MSELSNRLRVLADVSEGDMVMYYGLELTEKLREAAAALDRLDAIVRHIQCHDPARVEAAVYAAEKARTP